MKDGVDSPDGQLKLPLSLGFAGKKGSADNEAKREGVCAFEAVQSVEKAIKSRRKSVSCAMSLADRGHYQACYGEMFMVARR